MLHFGLIQPVERLIISVLPYAFFRDFRLYFHQASRQINAGDPRSDGNFIIVINSTQHTHTFSRCGHAAGRFTVDQYGLAGAFERKPTVLREKYGA